MDKSTLINLLIPVIVVQIILMVTALVQLRRASAVRGGYKWVWALVIIFINIIGPILFFAIGKKEN